MKFNKHGIAKTFNFESIEARRMQQLAETIQSYNTQKLFALQLEWKRLIDKTHVTTTL